MILAGARAFAEGFSNPKHPCRTDPCGECYDDAYRVLQAGLQWLKDHHMYDHEERTEHRVYHNPDKPFA